MITNDYKNIIRQMLSSGGTAQGLLPIKDVGGTTRYLAGYTAYPYTVSTTFTTTAANAGVSVGTGTTASTENDYQLESTVTSDLTGTVSVSKNVDTNGNAYVVLDVTLTNGGSDDISISEIGYKQELSASTTQNGTTTDDYVFLIDRTVLSSPIVIEAGQQGIIRYSLLTRTNLANSVEDVQVDGVSILDANNIAQLDSSDFGTTVVANPSDTATGTLTKIQIDDTVYTVQDSGSGSVTVFGTDETPTTVYTSEETPIVISVSGFTRTANNIIMVRLGKLSTISYTPLISEYTAGLYFNVNSLGAIPVYYNNTKVISDSVFTFDTQAIYVLLLRNIALQQESWRFDIIGISNSSGGNNVSYGTSNPSGGSDNDVYMKLTGNVPVSTYRYIKFQVTYTGANNCGCYGFDFTDNGDNAFAWPSGTTVTCDVSTYGEASKLIGDDYSNGVWTYGMPTFIITLPQGSVINTLTYTKYRWKMSSSSWNTYPKTWKLYLSNDGNEWTEVDSIADYVAPSTTSGTIGFSGEYELPDVDIPTISDIYIKADGTWIKDGFSTGGGSDFGGKYTCDLLFENDPLPAATSGTSDVERTYTLSHSIDGYDAVYVMIYNYHNAGGAAIQLMPYLILKKDFYTHLEFNDEEHTFLLNGSYSSNVLRTFFEFTDSTHIYTRTGDRQSGIEPILYRVYGLKFNATVFSPEIYSEEEREIGVWTDGKPLYQKTFQIGTPTYNAYTAYTHGIANVEKVVNIYGNCINNGTDSLPVPLANTNTPYVIFLGNAGATDFYYQFGSGFNSISDFTVTLQYTKTTDTPGSAHWLPGGTIAVNYTDTEQTVGQWMGQTLYQKTWDLGQGVSFANNTWTALTAITNVPSIEAIISHDASQDVSVGNRASVNIDVWNDNGTIKVKSLRTDNETIRYLTLRYTKTTDTPGSANPTILATQAELEAMVDHFQDGVDAVYDACVSKGSTPATHSLADVVDAIDNISGGGSTYAFLEFTYNQGTTVTATNSSTTLTSDTSGDYIFAIPNSGTWTFTSGGNSVSILVNEYGSRLNGRFTLLPYSILTNILAEATVDDYVAGATNWDAFTIGGTATITTDTSRTVLNLPQDAYAKYDLVDVNTPVTVYLISKEISGDQYGRIIEIPYARSDRNCPMFIAMNSGDVYYSTWGGSNEQATGVDPKSNYHVYAISLDMTNKYAHYCIDGNTCTTMPFNNSGDSVWLTEEHTFANDSGTNSNVLFAAVVDGNESDSVMQQNCSSLMTYFNIV